MPTSSGSDLLSFEPPGALTDGHLRKIGQAIGGWPKPYDLSEAVKSHQPPQDLLPDAGATFSGVVANGTSAEQLIMTAALCSWLQQERKLAPQIIWVLPGDEVIFLSLPG